MKVLKNGKPEIEIYLINLNGPLNERQYDTTVANFRNISQQGIKRVVVNLHDVPLIDSRGLAALVAGYKLFGRDPKKFRLVALQDQPKLVFELTGFDNIFEIFDDLAEATELEAGLCLELPRNLPVSARYGPGVDLTVV